MSSTNNNPNKIDPNHKSGATSMSTGAQMGIFAVMIGASAGFTLYTRKTTALTQQMRKLKAVRKHPIKEGPMTKEEWNKIKPLKGDDGWLWEETIRELKELQAVHTNVVNILLEEQQPRTFHC